MRIKSFILLLFCALFLLAGCAAKKEYVLEKFTEESEEETQVETYVDPNALHIGVSMQGLQREYINRVKEVLRYAEASYGGEIRLTILDGQEDPERQNAQIEKFITQNVDAIIFNPISYDEGKVGVQMANENGIPIVLLTTLVDGGLETAQAYAVSDHKESAYIQMDMVAEFLKYKGNIAILKGIKGVESEIGRTQGYEEKLKEYTGLKVVASQAANWSPDEAREIAENWIRLGKDIDVIIAQNDIMAQGALQAVQEADMQDEIAVFGIDGDDEALDLVKKRQLKGTVYHNAYAQGEKAVEYAVKLAKGETVKCEYISFHEVNVSNVDYFLTRNNYYNFGTIDSNEE